MCCNSKTKANASTQTPGQTQNTAFDKEMYVNTPTMATHNSVTVVPKPRNSGLSLAVVRAVDHNKVVETQESHYQTRDARMKKSEKHRLASKQRLERRRSQLIGRKKRAPGQAKVKTQIQNLVMPVQSIELRREVKLRQKIQKIKLLQKKRMAKVKQKKGFEV